MHIAFCRGFASVRSTRAIAIAAVVSAVLLPQSLPGRTFNLETYAGQTAFEFRYAPRWQRFDFGESAGSADGPRMEARFNKPMGLAIDPAGNLYVCDSQNYTIRKVTPDGVVSTYAGSAGQSGHIDGAASEARFSVVTGIAVDDDGTVFVADTGNFVIRMISPEGVVSTLAGQSGVSGTADGTGAAAQFGSVGSLALDGSGGLYVADNGSHRVRKVTRSGVVTSLATIPVDSSSVSDDDFAIAVGPDGLVYTVQGKSISRVTAEGSVTTLDTINGTTPFAVPGGAAFEPDGGLLFTLNGEGQLHRYRIGGPIETLTGLRLYSGHATPTYLPQDGAGRFGWCIEIGGIACAPSGEIFISDPATNIIRRGQPLPEVTRSRLTNLSVRGPIGGVGAPSIVGFVATGVGQKHLLIRGVGEGLESFGVSGTARRPRLTLKDAAGGMVFQTDRWEGGTWGLHPTKRYTELVGAFTLTGFDPSFYFPDRPTDVDSLFGLEAGAYTVGFEELIAAVDGSFSGIALMEIYDCDIGHDQSRLVNLSIRTPVSPGADGPIAGFVVEGPTNLDVLIRGIGPGLAPYVASDLLEDPELLLFREDTLLERNDDWGGDAEITADFAAVGAFSIPPDSKDAVLKLSLAPGAYTAHLRGVNDGTGLGLIEIYVLPES